jgi:5'-nucleotidase / UDP-sugar diphosphatase
MTMTLPFRRLALTLLGVGIALSLQAAAALAQSAKVTFILMNDVYIMGETAQPDGTRRGGFARLAAVVKAERAKNRHVILAHGGDTLSPSLMSGIDQGAHIVTLTNLLKPDVFVPGNHEFDFGKSIFLKRMADAKFPIFAANLRAASGDPLPAFKDREIIALDGVRIGLTGAAHDGTPTMSSPGDLKFLPTVATAREQAVALRREGADFVVAVMHADRTQGSDLLLTRAADLILTGHNHDLFVQFDGRTAMVESAHDAHYVTIVDVTIEVTQADGKRETVWWPQFRVIDTASVTPDPEAAAAVAAFENELAREIDAPLGTTGAELDSRNASLRTREAAIGNFIADAMRERTGADAALTNGGGIRGGKVYPAGTTLTRRDILTELPFGNRLVTIEIKGAALRKAIENGLSRLPDAAGRFPQVSGMKIEYDPRRLAGQRILSIQIGGMPLSDSRTYRVATNDFLALGGDGYETFGRARKLIPPGDSPLLANEVMVYLRNKNRIDIATDGRVRSR